MGIDVSKEVKVVANLEDSSGCGIVVGFVMYTSTMETMHSLIEFR